MPKTKQNEERNETRGAILHDVLKGIGMIIGTTWAVIRTFIKLFKPQNMGALRDGFNETRDL